MKATKITIEIVVLGDEPDAAWEALDGLLEHGVLQDPLNDCEEHAFKVSSAIVRQDFEDVSEAYAEAIERYDAAYSHVPDGC